ncbi:hypothetical protein [Thalassotalea mangrovi]|uniref:Uncharacterized protein n=1 Tax=Thalassotalea mangrovi TaxID=2572245 RepID=A0A4U1B6D4_9GAMM|nr:hypothetical protein [Thalassotalea mangrovi]TKB45712.1 hypothetical protein E8M12_07200 [Thalassotalea mangrovi]
MSLDIEKMVADKHIFYLPPLPLITIYDDNFFVRNDYDILSMGQRQYLINFFKAQGFSQKSGKLLTREQLQLHFPKPSHILAQSAFNEDYLSADPHHFYFVTPTTFAETLFQQGLRGINANFIEDIKSLIETCPFNLELVRDINITNQLGPFINQYYRQLERYQKQVIERDFKRKKAL